MKDKMVTRTVSVKNVTALAIDTKDANKVFDVVIPVVGVFKNDDELLSYIKKIIPSDDGLIIASILDVTEKEILYGMPESVFMQYAKELPPRSKTE